MSSVYWIYKVKDKKGDLVKYFPVFDGSSPYAFESKFTALRCYVNNVKRIEYLTGRKFYLSTIKFGRAYYELKD